MKQIIRQKIGPTQCEHCGNMWRVMPDGRIDFYPQSPAMHHPCHKCMERALKESKANIKATRAKVIKTVTRKEEETDSGDAES